MRQFNNLKVECYSVNGNSVSSGHRLFTDSGLPDIHHVRLRQTSPIMAEAILQAGDHTGNEYGGYIIEKEGEKIMIVRHGLVLPDSEGLYINRTVGEKKEFGGENQEPVDAIVNELFKALESRQLKVNQQVPRELAVYLHSLWVSPK